jgi:hypothetical protein
MKRADYIIFLVSKKWRHAAVIEKMTVAYLTASVVQWSDFLAADSEVSGSIPGPARFSE